MADELFRQDPIEESEPTVVQPDSLFGQSEAKTAEPVFDRPVANGAEPVFGSQEMSGQGAFSGMPGQNPYSQAPQQSAFTPAQNMNLDTVPSGYKQRESVSMDLGVEYDNDTEAGLSYEWSPKGGENMSRIPADEISEEPTEEKMKKKKRPKIKNEDVEEEEEKGRRGIGFGKLLVLAIIFGLVAGAAFQGVNLGIKKLTKKDSKTELAESKKKSEAVQTVTDPSLLNESGLPDVSGIVEAVQPSVVSVTIIIEQEVQYYFQTYTREAEGAGSGVIIGKNDDKLYVITNYHVVENADTIKIGFCDDSVSEAYVTGFDKEQDVAVVEVPFANMSEETASVIKVATIGDSDELKVGQACIAIGNPLGFGQSVTVGYISALHRGIEGYEGDYIQTDAAINPGNSGGALIDSEGRVIGINSAKYVDSKVEGMGFSIPINTAMDIVNDIIDGRQGKKAVFGASGFEVTREYEEIYGMPKGVFISKVTEDSPAAKAGIKEKDVIVEFDGHAVYTMEELKTRIEEKKVGDTVDVVYYRADQNKKFQKKTAKVTLAGQ